MLFIERKFNYDRRRINEENSGDLSAAYSAPSEDAKELDETTKDLIAALKEVLSRF